MAEKESLRVIQGGKTLDRLLINEEGRFCLQREPSFVIDDFFFAMEPFTQAGVPNEENFIETFVHKNAPENAQFFYLKSLRTPGMGETYLIMYINVPETPEHIHYSSMY